MSLMSSQSPFARPQSVPDLTISNAILPFYLEGGLVRGRLVRLGALADAILSRKTGDAALSLGGEALGLVAGLSAGLKFEGNLSLQVKGDGPLSLLIAECTHDGGLRLYLRVNDDAVSERPSEESVKADRWFGEGYLAFTIDQGSQADRQQGIVAIKGETLSEMAESYFQTSEQHPSFIRLFSRFHHGRWDAGALILERIAPEGGVGSADHPHDTWETAKILASTVTRDEIFDTTMTSEEILFRLFHSLGVRGSSSRPVHFGCRCSRDKLLTILQGFSDQDLDDMVTSGVITMSCEFCGIDFEFDRATLRQNHE